MYRNGWGAVIKKFEDTTGIRDLEQAAEHIAANALYQIEVDHVKAVTFTPEMVQELLDWQRDLFCNDKNASGDFFGSIFGWGNAPVYAGPVWS